MSKNLHEKPFDDATIAKLDIFEDYAQAWIPVFVMYGDPVICIFDFFAGTGYDLNGVPGSPIRILKKLQEQVAQIFQRKVRVKAFFNELDKKKFEQLSLACNDFINTYPELGRAIELEISNEEFQECFNKSLALIQEYPSLVYLDQNGIKFLADDYLLKLERTTRTDFLYFVSASYFWRFGDKEEFKLHVPLDMEEAKKNPYQYIHRSLLAQLRNKLPVISKLKLYPFSLKKGANIYGIIFGASHPKAVEKFLSIAWKRNGINGEANFDIDEDVRKTQLDLFAGKHPDKIELFQQRFRERVLDGSISNNFDAFDFALAEGHLGSHAADELKKMKKEKLIDYQGKSPLVTYEMVYKEKRRIAYQIIKP